MNINIRQIKRRGNAENIYTEILFQLTPSEAGKLLTDGILTIPIKNELDMKVAEYGVKLVKGRAGYE